MPLGWSILLVTAANLVVFGAIAVDLASGGLSLARAVVFVQSAIGTSLIGFGGLNWALDGAAARQLSSPLLLPAAAGRVRRGAGAILSAVLMVAALGLGVWSSVSTSARRANGTSGRTRW